MIETAIPKKNLIISGNVVPDNWELLRGIEEGSCKNWEVKQCVTSKYTGFNKITRYIKYFLYSLYILFIRNRYEDIITKDQFFGIILGFYIRLFHLKKNPNIYVMTFIYKKKRGIIGKIYSKFIRYSLQCDAIKKIIVFSKKETSFYKAVFFESDEKFVTETLGIKDVAENIKPNESNEKYYVTAGRSNRDYKFLKDNWDKDELLYLVSDMEKESDNPKIKVLNNCFEEEFLSLIAGAKAVIVPLKNKDISSGQLVVIQSSMLGIPCIVTENKAIEDYVYNGINGYIINKTKEDLDRALKKIEYEDVFNTLQTCGRKLYETQFTLIEMGRRIGRLVREVD